MSQLISRLLAVRSELESARSNFLESTGPTQTNSVREILEKSLKALDALHEETDFDCRSADNSESIVPLLPVLCNNQDRKLDMSESPGEWNSGSRVKMLTSHSHSHSLTKPLHTKVALVTENTEEDEKEVADWLNANFAEDRTRHSTGFEVQLPKLESMVSAKIVDEDDFDDRSKSDIISPTNATRYSRSQTRSFPAFAARSRFRALLKKVQIEEIEDINDPEFNIFPHYERLGDRILEAVAANVFLQYNFMSSLELNIEYFMNFLTQIRLHYLPHPYHNHCHAADVLQTTNVYLCCGNVKENFSDVELLAVLFAAMIHDVGHPGISNAFLISIHHPLAKLYNDASVLESMHAALAFIILDRPECNFFADSTIWSVGHYGDFRKLVISTVQATDIKLHNSVRNSVVDILEDGQIEDDEVTQLFRAIVHAADLSNPMKPLPVYLEWMERVNAEFWQQGDEERRRGFPISKLCDRAEKNIAKGQCGFIEYVVRPFMADLAPVLPPVWIDRLESNLEYFKTFSSEKEHQCVERIEAFSEAPWKDSPLQSATWISVLAKYLENFRLRVAKDLTGDPSANYQGLSDLGGSFDSNEGPHASRKASHSEVLQRYQAKLAEEAERIVAEIYNFCPKPETAAAFESFHHAFCTRWIVTISETQSQCCGELCHLLDEPSRLSPTYKPPEWDAVSRDNAFFPTSVQELIDQAIAEYLKTHKNSRHDDSATSVMAMTAVPGFCMRVFNDITSTHLEESTVHVSEVSTSIRQQTTKVSHFHNRSVLRTVVGLTRTVHSAMLQMKRVLEKEPNFLTVREDCLPSSTSAQASSENSPALMSPTTNDAKPVAGPGFTLAKQQHQTVSRAPLSSYQAPPMLTVAGIEALQKEYGPKKNRERAASTSTTSTVAMYLDRVRKLEKNSNSQSDWEKKALSQLYR